METTFLLKDKLRKVRNIKKKLVEIFKLTIK